jgi:hypothetical protein
MFQMRHRLAPAMTAAALLGIIVLTGPARAAVGDRAPGVAERTPSAATMLAQTTPPPPPPAATTPAPAAPAAPAPLANVESRIAQLHRSLHVTAAQETLWASVAQVMRDNAQAMEGLAKERYENSAKMTAIDDLRSYSALADAHADGLKKFVPVFQQLYDSMSDAQKKRADTLFRNRMHREAAKVAPKAQ